MIKTQLTNLGINVLCCEDLSSITNGPSEIYKLFQSLHRTKFESTDRICFYTTQPIPDLLWKHLYQAANQIDISNFFISIISNNDMSTISAQQAVLWSTDIIPFSTMQMCIVDSQPLKNNYVVPDQICPLPWTHLEISTNGDIKPCCKFQDVIANIKDTQLSDVFYNKFMTDLRTDFLSGKYPSGCSGCWKNEDQGVTSNRQRHLSLLKSQLLTKYIDDPKISSLDIKPGNTCNFKCRICGPDSSSVWAQEYTTNSKFNVSTVSYNWAEHREHMFDQIFDLADDLTNIDMYGGEPFLIKPLSLLVERLVNNNVAHKIRLHYNSNGSIWPDKLIPFWEHFLHVDLHFSIDNVHDKFELERGGTWHTIEQNIKRFKALNLSNLKISIGPVVSIMNVLYFDELLAWADDLGLPVNPSYLQYPDHLSIDTLTPDARKLIIEKYQNSNHKEIQKIINIVSNSVGSDGKKFVEYMQNLDHIRNENFSNSHKEIAKAMGYSI